jgi:hypothetical protein
MGSITQATLVIILFIYLFIFFLSFFDKINLNWNFFNSVNSKKKIPIFFPIFFISQN